MIANETTPLMTNRAFVWAGLLLAGLCTLAPSAQALVIVGNTTGGASWFRPFEGNPPTTVTSAPTANPFLYVATQFHVDVSGAYDFQTVPAPGFDDYTFLYHDSFSSGSPLTNVIIGNDDLGGGSGFTGVNLTAGVTYIFVETGFNSASSNGFGPYTATINGVGNAILGPFVVVSAPEPLSVGLFVTGLAGLAAARRRSMKQVTSGSARS